MTRSANTRQAALPRFAAADTRVNVGVLHAGTAPNIVAADAELRLELRATSGEVCEELDRRARAVQEQGGTATYLVVGASNPAPHHSPEFDIDEACLEIAVDTLERAVRTTDASSG
jgi:metal-dependent amidase/aminoacylase/carboxypeptidase family protein